MKVKQYRQLMRKCGNHPIDVPPNTRHLYIDDANLRDLVDWEPGEPPPEITRWIRDNVATALLSTAADTTVEIWRDEITVLLGTGNSGFANAAMELRVPFREVLDNSEMCVEDIDDIIRDLQHYRRRRAKEIAEDTGPTDFEMNMTENLRGPVKPGVKS